MMSYQNINQYNYRKLYLNLIYGEYDICLASDEVDYNMEAIFSPYLIAQTDGNRLPIYIDLNNSGSTQQFILNYKQYNSANTIVSLNYYNPKNLDLVNCYTSETLCNIGLVGTDNGLVTQMTGETITVATGLLPDNEKFDRFSYDSRFKMIQVTGYTQSPNTRFPAVTANTLYEIVSATGTTEGYYNELYGGWYQSFYKLFGYDYEVFPERTNLGWSVEMVLKPRLTDFFFPNSGETTVNKLFPQNANTFFYFGTRAENKYYHYAAGNPIISGSPFTGYTRVTSDLSSCLYTCGCSMTAFTADSRCILVYPQSASTAPPISSCCSCPPPVINISPDTDPAYDAYSNALSVRFSGDPSNPKICIKTLTITGGCEMTGSCFTTGMTYTTGYTFSEYCTDKPIYWQCSANTAFTSTEHWVLIDLVWTRNTYLSDCDLLYKGGLDLITNTEFVLSLEDRAVELISPNPDLLTVDQISFNTRWIDELNYRQGTLTLYVDGKYFQSWTGVEEVIPHALNCEKEKQIGVPFNISFGGGTQGLKENLIFSACPTGFTNNYIQDPEDLSPLELSGSSLSGLTNDILIEQNFAGSFEGGISQYRMYVYPMGADDIHHNFEILLPIFDFFNPDCPQCLDVP